MAKAKVAPSDIGAQSTGNTSVDQAIFTASQEYGVPAAVLFADAQIESGLNPNAVGDQGTSFGLFQEHDGGELSTVANAVNPSYAADLAAQTFKAAQQANPNMTWGQIAAAAQRPADQAGYAAKVNAELGTAGYMPSQQASQVLGNTVSKALVTPGSRTSAVPTNAYLTADVTTSGGAQTSAEEGYALLNSIVGGNMPTSGTASPYASNYESAVSTMLQNPQYSSQALGSLAGAAAPGIAGAGLTEAQALAQAGVSGAAVNLGAQNLALNTGYGLAQDVGTIQSNQLQQQGLASQIGTAAQQQGFETSEYQNQLAQLGVTAASQGSQQAYIGQEASTSGAETANQEAQIANQEAQINYETPLAVQAQRGQSGAAGASNTVGAKNAVGNIQETSQNQLTGLALQGAEAGIQGQGLQQGYQQQLAQLGFSQQGTQLQQQLAGIQQQSEVSGYQGQSQQYANAQQQLQLAAKQAGIPVQQLISQLGYGLQQLGITNDPTQYLAQAAQAQGTQASDWSAVLSGAGVIGGLGPSTMASAK